MRTLKYGRIPRRQNCRKGLSLHLRRELLFLCRYIEHTISLAGTRNGFPLCPQSIRSGLDFHSYTYSPHNMLPLRYPRGHGLDLHTLQPHHLATVLHVLPFTGRRIRRPARLRVPAQRHHAAE